MIYDNPVIKRIKKGMTGLSSKLKSSSKEPEDKVVGGLKEHSWRPYKKETEEYKSLLSLLQGMDRGLLNNRSSRMSLAFLVEERKRVNPGEWQNELKDLKEEVISINKEKGISGVSFFMSEKITSAYTGFLNRKIKDSKDRDIKNRLEIMKEMSEEDLKFAARLCKEGKTSGFGGVSIDDVPAWYYIVK